MFLTSNHGLCDGTEPMTPPAVKTAENKHERKPSKKDKDKSKLTEGERSSLGTHVILPPHLVCVNQQ